MNECFIVAYNKHLYSPKIVINRIIKLFVVVVGTARSSLVIVLVFVHSSHYKVIYGRS